MSRKPSVTTSSTRVPLRESTAFRATVVPCTNHSTSAASTLCASPSSTASA